MADVAARWVLEVQAGAPPGRLAGELEAGADFHFVVHNAAGMVSVQLGISVTEALIRLRAYAFSNDRLLGDVAQDVVARTLRLAMTPPSGAGTGPADSMVAASTAPTGARRPRRCR